MFDLECWNCLKFWIMIFYLYIIFNDFFCKFNGYVNIILVYKISFVFLYKIYIYIYFVKWMYVINIG